MTVDNIEPLEPGTWLIQLRNLALQRPANEPSLAASLRRAFHLVQLTPRPLRHVIVCRAAEADFDTLLERGALVEATEALMGKALSYSLVLAPVGGIFEAEVQFPGGHACSRVAAQSAPLALFAAWLECLLTLTQAEEPREDRTRGPVRFPGQRRSRYEPRPRLTEH